MTFDESCSEVAAFEHGCLEIARRELADFWTTGEPWHLGKATRALDDYYSAHAGATCSNDAKH